MDKEKMERTQFISEYDKEFLTNGLKIGMPYSRAEDKFLKEHYGELKTKDLAKLLHRVVSSINDRAGKLKLKKEKQETSQLKTISENKREKNRNYMREYRKTHKTPYDKEKSHQYYIRRSLKQNKMDERLKQVIAQVRKKIKDAAYIGYDAVRRKYQFESKGKTYEVEG